MESGVDKVEREEWKNHLEPDEHGQIVALGEPGKGWNRASIVFWSRKQPMLEIGPKDFLLPSGGRLKLAAMSVFIGAAFTMLYGWTSLFVVTVITGSGPWFWPLLGAVAVVISAFVFYRSAFESERDRRIARDL